MFDPMRGMGLLFLPVFIPGFLFGIIYLFISSWLEKRGGGNINHSAHIWGAVFGIAFAVVACRVFSNYPVLEEFIEQVRNFDWSKLISFG